MSSDEIKFYRYQTPDMMVGQRFFIDRDYKPSNGNYRAYFSAKFAWGESWLGHYDDRGTAWTQFYSIGDEFDVVRLEGDVMWARQVFSSKKLSMGDPKMNGNIYDGVVVQTKKVPAGDGCVECVDVTSVVFVTPKPFMAKDDAQAQSIALAMALKADATLDAANVLAPVEVKVRKY